MPLNANGQNACLTGGLGNAITHVSAHTGIPDATGSNEATGGSPAYARQAVTWAAASAGTRANSGALTNIDVAAGTYYALGLWSAVTTGTHYGWMPINGTQKFYGVAGAADVTADTIQTPGHGLANTNQVVLSTVFGGALPAGLNATTAYFVVGAATDTFQVALTSGGAAVNITGSGELFWSRIIPEVFASQGQISVASGALVLDLTGIG